MRFIDAIVLINKRKDLSLCDYEKELNGIESSICVYKKIKTNPQLYVGCLRWPRDGQPAEVDPGLIEELEQG